MRVRHFLRAVFLGLSVTTLSFAAAADTAGAQSFVEREAGQIKKLVDQNAPVADVTKVISDMVDPDAIAQASLGNPCPATVPSCTNHWAELKPEQQKEVRDLFKQIVERKYRDNAYKTKDYDMTVLRAKEETSNLTKVRTEAKNKTKPRDPPVQVDYIIRCDAQNVCKAVDLIMEGSRMTKNYYDQSHKMLTTEGQGYPYFLQKLKDRAAGKTNKDSALK